MKFWFRVVMWWLDLKLLRIYPKCRTDRSGVVPARRGHGVPHVVQIPSGILGADCGGPRDAACGL